MKKSAAIFLIISMFLALSGCTGAIPYQDIDTSSSVTPNMNSNEEFAFMGESESWTAKLVLDYDFMFFEEDEVFQTGGDEHSALYVTYKGDISDLESVKNLRIVCGEDSIEDTFNNGHSSTVKTFKLPVSLEEINKDDTIEAMVTADSDTQTLLLKTSNSKETFVNGNDDYAENHYVFKGESASWMGEMTVDSTMQFYETDGILGCDADGEERLTVTYKGNISGLGPVKKLKIDYDGPSGGGGFEESYDPECPLQDSTYILSSGSSGGSLIQEDSVIIVTVTIDDKTESFKMRNEA